MFRIENINENIFFIKNWREKIAMIQNAVFIKENSW